MSPESHSWLVQSLPPCPGLPTGPTLSLAGWEPAYFQPLMAAGFLPDLQHDGALPSAPEFFCPEGEPAWPPSIASQWRVALVLQVLRTQLWLGFHYPRTWDLLAGADAACECPTVARAPGPCDSEFWLGCARCTVRQQALGRREPWGHPRA